MSASALILYFDRSTGRRHRPCPVPLLQGHRRSFPGEGQHVAETVLHPLLERKPEPSLWLVTDPLRDLRNGLDEKTFSLPQPKIVGDSEERFR